MASKCDTSWSRTLTNNEGKIAAITKALSSYKEMYQTHINNLKQCRILDYLERKTPAKPAAIDNPQPPSTSCLSRKTVRMMSSLAL